MKSFHQCLIANWPRGDPLISNDTEIWERRSKSAIAVISDEGHKVESHLWLKLVFVGWLLFIATSIWQWTNIWDDLGRLFQSRLASVSVGVLMPSGENAAIRENANRQLLGFRKAFDKHDVVDFEDWGLLEQTYLTYEELQELKALPAISENEQPDTDKIKEFFENLPPLTEDTASTLSAERVESIGKSRQLIISEPEKLIPILKNMADLNQHVHRFPYPFEKPAGDQPCDKPKEEQISDYCKIFDQLDEWYDAGKRIFVVTMSGAALEIRDDFKLWAEGKPQTDQPVLVATVASAPGIANLEDGVFRHYIRSQDESDVFATFVESLPPLSGSGDRPVFVLYVDDKYGIAANRNIKKRLGEAGIKTQGSHIPVKRALSDEKTGDHCDNGPTKECIELKTEQSVFLDSAPNGDRKNRDAIVIIVGYGTIIERLLNALRGELWQHPRYEGEVIVVSTFTEEAWRPQWLDSDEMRTQVNTVAPKSPKANDLPYTRGVVFQWSYLTLDRALALRNVKGCENVREHDEFWHCWANYGEHRGVEDKDIWAEVEFTESGDSRVKLRLLKCNQWNTTSNLDSC